MSNEAATSADTARQKEFEGVVVSTKMDSTAVVEIARFVRHPRYKKFVAPSKRFKAHDEGNQCRVGDRVTIRESRPLSKDKHFVVTNRIPVSEVDEADANDVNE